MVKAAKIVRIDSGWIGHMVNAVTLFITDVLFKFLVDVFDAITQKIQQFRASVLLEVGFEEVPDVLLVLVVGRICFVEAIF